MTHYIAIDGNNGQIHPHTWEFVFVAIIGGDNFIEFRTLENIIEGYMERFQDQTLNDIAPFDITNPTIENVVDYFAEELRGRVKTVGAELVSVEGSETPTRSYIVNFRNDEEFIKGVEDIKKEQINQIVNDLVEQIADNIKHRN